MARFTARLLEYPISHLGLAGGGWPFAHLLRPLAVGFLGLALAVLDRPPPRPGDEALSPLSQRHEQLAAAAKPVAKARR